MFPQSASKRMRGFDYSGPTTLAKRALARYVMHQLAISRPITSYFFPSPNYEPKMVAYRDALANSTMVDYRQPILLDDFAPSATYMSERAFNDLSKTRRRYASRYRRNTFRRVYRKAVRASLRA